MFGDYSSCLVAGDTRSFPVILEDDSPSMHLSSDDTTGSSESPFTGSPVKPVKRRRESYKYVVMVFNSLFTCINAQP